MSMLTVVFTPCLQQILWFVGDVNERNTSSQIFKAMVLKKRSKRINSYANYGLLVLLLMLLLLVNCVDVYRVFDFRTIVSGIGTISSFIIWQYCLQYDVMYEQYIYNFIKKARREQDKNIESD